MVNFSRNNFVRYFYASQDSVNAILSTTKTIRYGSLILLSCFVEAAISAPICISKIALTNDPTPEIGPDVTIEQVTSPSLNNTGEVLLLSTLNNAGIASPKGIWVATPDERILIVATGQHAPGTVDDVNFTTFDGLNFNDAGQVSFRAHTFGPGINFSNGSGIWSGSGDQLSLVARKSSQTSASPFVVYGAMAFPRINEAGQTAFMSTGAGLFIADSGNAATPIVMVGDDAPDTEAGVTFNEFDERPVFNDAGQISFKAKVSGPGTNGNNSTGIWSNANGPLTLIAREGTQATDLADGVLFGRVERPLLSNSGTTIFRSSFYSPGVPFSSGAGTWIHLNSNTSLLAKSGDPAPGFGPDVIFETISPTGISNEGKALILARVSGAGITYENRDGLWVSDGQTLSKLIQQGDPGPGTNMDEVFHSFSKATVNNANQVAYSAFLRGPNVTTANDRVIIVQDLTTGMLTLIVREGDFIEVGEDEQRLVQHIEFFTDPHKDLNGFNDDGQVAFYALFQDGTNGVFLADQCYLDNDEDGVADDIDNCPLIPNPDQENNDGDSDGDACDTDDDNDGVEDTLDNCPSTSNSEQTNFDGDETGDVCDDDIDGDEIENNSDICANTTLGDIIDPENGCSLEQLVPCMSPIESNLPWRSHGKYVSQYSKTAKDFIDRGLIESSNYRALISEAAKSNCGKK